MGMMRRLEAQKGIRSNDVLMCTCRATYSLRCPFGIGGEAGANASIRYIERMLVMTNLAS